MIAEARDRKAALRTDVLRRRRLMGDTARSRQSADVTAHLLGQPELVSARCVAAYLSFGTEPATPAALAALASRGARVLLPVLLPDRDLDWAIYVGPGPAPHPDGLWTSPGPRLGRDAVADADVVVVPALAVGADGTRLGRGGGSYDRALSRVPGGRPVVALLYAGELLPGVPSAPHDRSVTHAVTPDGVTTLTGSPSP